MPASVVGVHRGKSHGFSKPAVDAITLLEGIGVEGDAHAGKSVKHRSRVARDPTQPNLRQVHLIHSELHEELLAKGFRVTGGQMGENVTTRGIDLLSLPVGARLRLGLDAIVIVTGLRNPCLQLDEFQPGLMNAVLEKTPAGELLRKAGIMATVATGGIVRPGDTVEIELPAPPHVALKPV